VDDLWGGHPPGIALASSAGAVSAEESGKNIDQTTLSIFFFPTKAPSYFSSPFIYRCACLLFVAMGHINLQYIDEIFIIIHLTGLL
jgi:hypothetical protein